MSGRRTSTPASATRFFSPRLSLWMGGRQMRAEAPTAQRLFACSSRVQPIVQRAERDVLFHVAPNG